MNGHCSLVLVLEVIGLCLCYPNGPPVNIGHNRKAVCVDMYPSGKFQHLFLQHFNREKERERERERERGGERVWVYVRGGDF